MLASWVLGVAAVVGFVAGLMIGCIGVGGVILVPILTQLEGVKIHTAVASCMFSYIFAGLAGLLIYRSHNSIVWADTLYFGIGATPAAFLGSYALTQVGGFELQVVVYSLVLLSAVFSLFRICTTQKDSDTVETSELEKALETEVNESGPAAVFSTTELSVEPVEDEQFKADQKWFCVVAGAIDGFGSALTGTSGPVILLPMLILKRWPILPSLGHAQAIQFPIAIMSTIGNVVLKDTKIDFALGGIIAATSVVGVVFGANAAHKVPTDTLKLMVAVVLCVAGTVLVSKVTYEHMNG